MDFENITRSKSTSSTTSSSYSNSSSVADDDIMTTKNPMDNDIQTFTDNESKNLPLFEDSTVSLPDASIEVDEEESGPLGYSGMIYLFYISCLVLSLLLVFFIMNLFFSFF
jgi:hypothetical protein